jgi:hypothetical protein
MPSIVPCLSCSEQVRVPEELLGKAVKCPRCGETFTAPASAAFTPTPAAIPVGEPTVESDHIEEDDRPWEHDTRVHQGRLDAEPHRGTLILTLGIISVASVGAIVCWGLGSLVGLPLGIAAWVMGHKDLKKIRANQMDREGEGSTTAGRILGIIGTILGGLGLVGMLTCFAGYAAILAFAFRNGPPVPPPPPVQVAPPPTTTKKAAVLPPQRDGKNAARSKDKSSP